MARLSIDEGILWIHLSMLERFGALVDQVPSAPLSAVRSVRVTDKPWAELRGIRAPGTGWPGVIALGTRRHSLGRDFAAGYGKGPAVVVELTGQRFLRWVVSAHDAPEVGAQIEREMKA
jgi:hypothetical protein